jgi:hypothetical protein
VQQSWSPARGLVVTGWLAAAVALLLAAFAGDAPGRLLGVVATLGLALAALFGTVARPRLLVDEEGVAVRGLLGPRRWPWSRVHRMRIAHHRRLGREVAMLELDALDPDGSEHLIVLGRLDLNAAPEDVLTAVHALRGL